MSVVAFEVDPTVETEGIRRALARCRRAVRIERAPDRHVRLVVDAQDVADAMPAWLRTGLGRPRAWQWPAADAAGPDSVLASGRWWHAARLALPRPPAGGHAVLLLVPVESSEVARAISATLTSSRRNLRQRREPRQLARWLAGVLAGADGVARAQAFGLGTGETPAEARARARAVTGRGLRLGPRVPVNDVWRRIADPAGGVWRLLSELESWWT